MALASPESSSVLINSRRERKVESFFNARRALNNGWTIDNNTATAYENKLNLSVFSQEKFDRNGRKSFLVKISGREKANDILIGVTSTDFIRSCNSKVEDDRSFWNFISVVNPHMGRATECFNTAVSLSSNLYINGALQARPDSLQAYLHKEVNFQSVLLRVDVEKGEISFRCPDLWSNIENHSVHASIPVGTGDLVLGVCAPGKSLSFTLYEIAPFTAITPHSSLKRDGVWLPAEGLFNQIEERTKKIVQDLRRKTREMDNRINISIIGRFGHGKSALTNTLITLFEDDWDTPPSLDNQVVLVADGVRGTGTTECQLHQLPGSEIFLLDTFGTKVTAGKDGKGVNWDGFTHLLLRGNVGDGFIEADTKGPTMPSETDPRAVENPFDQKQQEEEREVRMRVSGYRDYVSPDDRNHGIIGVVNANTPPAEIEAFWAKVSSIRGRERSLPMVGALTKVDKFMDDEQKDLLRFSVIDVYDNPELFPKLQNAKRILGIPNVFPIRSYTDENERNIVVEYLAAEMLKRIVEAALRYKEKLIIKEQQQQQQSQRIATDDRSLTSEEYHDGMDA